MCKSPSPTLALAIAVQPYNLSCPHAQPDLSASSSSNQPICVTPFDIGLKLCVIDQLVIITQLMTKLL